MINLVDSDVLKKINKFLAKKNVDKFFYSNQNLFKIFILDDSNASAWNNVEIKEADDALLFNVNTSQIVKESIKLRELNEKKVLISIDSVKKLLKLIIENDQHYDDFD